MLHQMMNCSYSTTHLAFFSSNDEIFLFFTIYGANFPGTEAIYFIQNVAISVEKSSGASSLVFFGP